MRFDANRLASLAGIQTDSSESLNEASNRSYHDGVANDAVEDRFGKNQLAERKHDDDDVEEMKGVDLEESEHGDEIEEEDVVLEIDERMLRNEIRKMRAARLTGQKIRENKSKRSARRKQPKASRQSIQEAKLRQAIRNEIRGIFEELNADNVTSSWLYGDNQPTNSKKGFVNTMFPGVGFR